MARRGNKVNGNLEKSSKIGTNMDNGRIKVVDEKILETGESELDQFWETARKRDVERLDVRKAYPKVIELGGSEGGIKVDTKKTSDRRKRKGNGQIEERGMADVDVRERRKMESGEVVEDRATTGRIGPRIE